ncbi:RB1-inducible coiled-coil protein 1 [Aphelenchoides fujianensis]|nr:RB1-inducible coiled-coil protein 1 [Aphelenchoides fujianensis]
MYHVFYVNDGYMLAVEIPPVGHFRDLHHELTTKTGVPPGDQVFFLGSGEALIGDYSLSAYSDAGTEQNPIYFIKRVSSEKDPINSREEEGINNLFSNWKREVEEVHQQGVKQSAVKAYSDAGESGIRVAETLIRYCAKIVSEHLYLNHGWQAVTTNLDENLAQISTRFGRAFRIAQRLPQIRKHSQVWVSDFQIVFEALSKIKIPASLMNKSSSGTSTESESLSTGEAVTLFEWIENHDPVYTLDVLIEHVSQHIEKLDDNDFKKASDALKYVKNLNKQPGYREIRGVDKRLASLDARLVALENSLHKLKEVATRLINPQYDQNNYRNVVNDQRDRLNRITSTLDEFTGHAHMFLNSKMELLKNVRTRLAGWIRQGYDHLQSAHTDLTLFEEKFNGFRQRLDLVRQVREAPILFVAAVSEVIRRQAFREEFDCWLALFIQKCSEFIKEENITRAEFFCKLEKHFLREIFSDMGDELPNFCPAKVKIDAKLPLLDAQVLRELRETLRDCEVPEDLFKIATPNVFPRLLVEDPKSAASTRNRPQFIHRDESFFVHDKGEHAIESKFPSTTWLNAADEPTEMSPLTNQFYLSRAGGSNSSLNADSNVTTPSDLVPTLESIKPLHAGSIPREVIGTPSSVDLTSPTSIHPDRHPTKQTARRSPSAAHRPVFHTGGDSQVSLNTKDRDMSDSTTPLYTPMLSPTAVSTEHFDQHTQTKPEKIDEEEEGRANAQREKMREDFAGLKNRVAELTNELSALRVEVGEQSTGAQSTVESQIQAIADKAAAIQTEAKERADELDGVKEQLKSREAQWEETNAQMAALKAENEKLKEILEHEKYLRTEKESEAHQKSEMLKKLNDDLLKTIQAKDEMQVELLRAESGKQQLESQIKAAADVDYLSIELDIVSQILKRELQPEEVEQVRAEIEKRKAVRRNDTDQSADIESKLRGEYEAAFRRKMAFVVQGIEEKKNEELAKIREENEAEIKAEYTRYIQKMKERIAELEQKAQFYESTSGVLAASTMTFPTTNTESFISHPLAESCQVVAEEDADDAIEEETRTIEETNEEEAEVEKKDDDAPTASKPSDEQDDAEDEDQAIAPVRNTTIATQTKVRGRDLRMMITLHEITEGWAVILVHSKTHNSFCVFSVCSSLYFVKQRSLRRLGVDPNAAPPQNTMLFARIANVELCETKKAPNRYNLPPNTRFYRVDVAPMPVAGLSLISLSDVQLPAETSASSSTRTI